MSMTRGFMYAGAASVMSSFWEVDDEATTELMKRVYDAMLREGQTPAAALRSSQNAIRAQKGWQAPYYWAAFTVQGQYRRAFAPPPAASRFTRQAVIGLALLALLLSIGLWRVKRQTAEARA